MYHASLKSLFLFLALSLSCFAKTTAAEYPAAQQFGAWLQAFNPDDRAAYRSSYRRCFLRKQSIWMMTGDFAR